VRLSETPFGTTDWSEIERTEHKGETRVTSSCVSRANFTPSLPTVGSLFCRRVLAIKSQMGRTMSLPV
jgi:hypothetical protein